MQESPFPSPAAMARAFVEKDAAAAKKGEKLHFHYKGTNPDEMLRNHVAIYCEKMKNGAVMTLDQQKFAATMAWARAKELEKERGITDTTPAKNKLFFKKA